MTKPKILVIIPSGQCFGLQNISFDYIDTLDQAAEFSFVTTRWNDGEFLRRVRQRGYTYYEAWLGFISRSLAWRNLKMSLEALSKLPMVWWTVWRAIRGFQPKVIWMANCQELIFLWPLLWILRVRVVCHMHDAPPATTFYRGAFYLWSLPVVSFVAISRATAQKMAALGCPEKKVHLIYNGIKLDKFTFKAKREDRFIKEFGLSNEAFLVGLTGQMHADKGHEDLIRACALIRERVPSIKIILGGPREETDYVRRLKKLIEEFEMGQLVYFSGWRREAAEFYHNVDLLVVPSRHQEGFGLVAAEALACGCPVLGAESGGMREVLEDSVVGGLVRQSCPQDLAEHLERWVKKSQPSPESRMLGRIHIQNNFSMNRQAQLLFRQLLGGSEVILS